MRFLADENVSRVTIQRLRAIGFDVTSISETEPGASDGDVLRAADVQDRILITEDRDFGELVIRQRQEVRGVVLLELDRVSNATEADVVAEVLTVHADKLLGNLLVIEPGRIRVRPLPR
jgi:predicted nuclease of predicted toxin-antitoxin system